MGSKVNQTHTFGLTVSGQKKRERRLKRGLITAIIYFGVFNYIFKTSYRDYIVRSWLFQ